jgi:hypothetical protein
MRTWQDIIVPSPAKDFVPVADNLKVILPALLCFDLLFWFLWCLPIL